MAGIEGPEICHLLSCYHLAPAPLGGAAKVRRCSACARLGATSIRRGPQLSAADVEPTGAPAVYPRRSPKLSVEQRNEIVRRYLAGESPVALAKEFGVSKGYAWTQTAWRGLSRKTQQETERGAA